MNNCIILHLYYQELWPEFKKYLKEIVDEKNHLYVSVCRTDTPWYEDIKSLAKEVYVLKNKGFDFGPFVYIYSKIKDMDYQNIVKLHGKKSVHTPGLADTWRPELYMNLIGNRNLYHNLMQQIASEESIYMVNVQKYFIRETKDSANYIAIDKYLDRLCEIMKVKKHDEGLFFAGSMFVCSKKYLDLLFEKTDLEELYLAFEDGYQQVSLAHAMERVIGFNVHDFGGTYAII